MTEPPIVLFAVEQVTDFWGKRERKDEPGLLNDGH
jgi:hypothetical protein